VHVRERTMTETDRPTPIADLHCDLLSFLAVDPARSADDPRARSAIPQLRAGGVRLQILAMFTITGSGSSSSGLAQAGLFEKLVAERPGDLVQIRDARALARMFEDDETRTGVVAAVENASGFCEEDEPLDAGLDRLREILQRVGRLLYVSLTWNDENRFGGGNNTRVGLKDDGRRLLDYLAEAGIAVDFSHTSDDLAEGILAHSDRNGLDLRVLASHSNFRAKQDVARNLPDDLARELAHRGGVQGINFIASFLGPDGPENLAQQIDYGSALIGEGRVVMGADFFCSDDLPPAIRRRHTGADFFDGFGDSSCYPRVQALLRDGDSRRDFDALFWRNAVRFIEGVWRE